MAKRAPVKSVEVPTVADLLNLRNRCRYGLGKLLMMHFPSDTPFVCGGSVWEEGDTGELLIRLDDAPSSGTVPAKECFLLEPWPVVCCKPDRRLPVEYLRAKKVIYQAAAHLRKRAGNPKG